jgi:uncharacterized protein (TIGR03437 family)
MATSTSFQNQSTEPLIAVRVLKRLVLASAFPVILYSFAEGPPPRKTGAPGDTTCQTCHGQAGGGKVEVSFPGGLFYTPGAKQTFTITITEPDPSADGAYGFEMTARLDNDQINGQAGDFIPSDNQQVICDDGSMKSTQGCPIAKPVQFIEHNTPLGNVIAVTWTAPLSNVGNVHIYVAAMAGTASIGHTYKTAYVLAPSASPTAPTIVSGGVVNGASFLPGIQENCFVTIAGTNLSSTTRTLKPHTEIIDGKLPTSLDGVSVTINGKPAFMYFISPTQIDVIAPGDETEGAVEVKVANPNGTSNAAIAQLQKYAPAFFTFSEQGGKYIAALIALSGGKVDYLGPVGLFGSKRESRPVKPGEAILLYGTGFGPTDPPVPSGMVFNGALQVTGKVSVTIGGVPAKVLFAGAIGVGEYQINVKVPAVPNGNQTVIATIEGVSSQQNAFIAVRN